MAQEAPNGWCDALALATSRHGETMRKGGGRIPYVTHVVEDTSATLHEVRWRIGDAVADLVRAVPKDDAAMEQLNGWTVVWQ